MENISIVDHPVINHYLSVLRDKKTCHKEFRQIMKIVGSLLIYEATRSIETKEVSIETPLEVGKFPMIHDPLNIISIMRAANGFVEAGLDLFPFARGGHIGLKRVDHGNVTKEYYFKTAPLENSQILLVDPMVATGGSVCHAIEKLKKHNPKKIKFVCLLMSPQGAKRLYEEHPDVEVVTASIDRDMNDNNYILPGLGDAGDRFYGTEQGIESES